MQVYNTLTRSKQQFTPITANKVGMYVCGITVYDYCHVGHARVYVGFDVIVRYFKFLGFEVNYVRNITDIDDKIIKKANEMGTDFTEITKKFIALMHEDLAALKVLPPTAEPKATEHMPHIIALIEKLLAKDFAYVASNGDVYFQVKKFAEYGKLANKDLEDLRVGARVDVVEAKQDPLDFVLWKLSKANEPSWQSPWGQGRPGWHIECSAMSLDALGETFDIHGGGCDLQFPHHENEIAQSQGATGKKFVNNWLHFGFVQIDNTKMSKSLGNFFTIREVLKHYHSEVVRYFLIASHYRSPINYSLENLDNAKHSLERLYLALRGIDNIPAITAATVANSEYGQRFKAAMDDDFNTPEALAVVFDLAREINVAKDKQQFDVAQKLAAELRFLANEVLGILNITAEEFLQGGDDDSDAEIDKLIAKRELARKEKNWQLADEIRDELQQKGIILEDSKGVTTWRRG